MISSSQIRSKFLSYYKADGHREVPSSPVVTLNDPSLMFTNSGMVQFKNVFTGQEKRDYKRATTSQKCVRAGGKHNDLENVGYTARHHTFFEMLGNFSFGDYFKEHAIEMAWKLLTLEYGLPKEKLLVTVYSEDGEAAALWRKIAGLNEERIIRIPTSDNFWSMGDTGPCGPCSEIFYDHGDKVQGGPPGSADEDGDRFIEIWNLVFMQYEQISKDKRIALPNPSIDTGMGLERISAVMQGKHDNYDVDLMRGLIEASAHASSVDADGELNVSHRIIADHLRSSAFLIADGVTPSNEGRGYVLRRIMRRAMRHVHLLGQCDPMMCRLVPALVDRMGDHFGELKDARALITETLKLEETNFKKTLDRGLKLLSAETAKLGGGQALAGDVAFKLYDTYGFPLDLTQDILRSENRAVDMSGYQAAMDQQRRAARAAWKGSGDAATQQVWFDVREEQGATDFLGYASTNIEGKILALVQDGKTVEVLNPDEEGVIITNQTVFYAESGGQQGDRGLIAALEGEGEFFVSDTTKKTGDLWLHSGKSTAGTFRVGQEISLSVDTARRDTLCANHSATHLLHESLRRTLGDHVAQKGSMVAADRLRFDFSHSRPISAGDLKTIQMEVNRKVMENSRVRTRLMDVDTARAEGALALFGEKYGDEVRVVTMGGTGTAKDEGTGASAYSIELCGGTHVQRTGDIGGFRILSEESLASGVRRIEAVTGLAMIQNGLAERQLLDLAAGSLKAAVTDIPKRITGLQGDKKRLEQEVAALRRQIATGTGGQGANLPETLNGIKFVGKILPDTPAKELKGYAGTVLSETGEGVVALIAAFEGKVSAVVAVSKDLSARYNAVDLVQTAARVLGGKGGGGRPDMAQAGGTDAGAAEQALSAVKDALK